MIVKASELRRNFFTLLDRCLETGETVEVTRKADHPDYAEPALIPKGMRSEGMLNLWRGICKDF